MYGVGQSGDRVDGERSALVLAACDRRAPRATPALLINSETAVLHKHHASPVIELITIHRRPHK